LRGPQTGLCHAGIVKPSQAPRGFTQSGVIADARIACRPGCGHVGSDVKELKRRLWAYKTIVKWMRVGWNSRECRPAIPGVTLKFL
jgi:hypothetical protein